MAPDTSPDSLRQFLHITGQKGMLQAFTMDRTMRASLLQQAEAITLMHRGCLGLLEMTPGETELAVNARAGELAYRQTLRVEQSRCHAHFPHLPDMNVNEPQTREAVAETVAEARAMALHLLAMTSHNEFAAFLSPKEHL